MQTKPRNYSAFPYVQLRGFVRILEACLSWSQPGSSLVMLGPEISHETFEILRKISKYFAKVFLIFRYFCSIL